MSSISRRDLLNGLLWTGASVSIGWPIELMAKSIDSPLIAPPLMTSYPPALTGLRGSHPGAFEAAHTLAWTGQMNVAESNHPAEEVDCIIIGAGISGLSAAYFYQQEVNSKARILLLDNHDDFGGHAKRNEFSVEGVTYLSYGGTQSFDTPSDYSKTSKKLLKALEIDLTKLNAAYDKTFFQRFDIGLGIYLDKTTFGASSLKKSGLPTQYPARHYSRYFVPGMVTVPEFQDVIDTLPLTTTQRDQLKQVFTDKKSPKRYFRGKDIEKSFYDDRYVDYLKETFDISDPALILLLTMPLAEDYALVGHAISIADAVGGGLAGLPPAEFFEEWVDEEDLPDDGESDEYAYHFPDGNATLARMLVKHLIPNVATFEGMESAVTARFDYSRLDNPGQAVNIRLNSLAMQVNPHPFQNGTEGVTVKYLKNDLMHTATARHCVMAGWHMMAAHMIPSLPERQKKALRANIKMPLVYAQVILRQWAPLQKSGVITAYCPGAYFQFVVPDFPVNIGTYQPQRDPAHPIVMLMIRNPCPTQVRAEVADLLRQGRAALLGTSFETFESEIRAQLNNMYAPFGFVSDRDIAGITVNRWPHGYVYDGAEIDGERACLRARKPHGNIVFANADASGLAYTDAAIDSAWRAIGEIQQ